MDKKRGGEDGLESKKSGLRLSDLGLVMVAGACNPTKHSGGK